MIPLSQQGNRAIFFPSGIRSFLQIKLAFSYSERERRLGVFYDRQCPPFFGGGRGGTFSFPDSHSISCFHSLDFSTKGKTCRISHV